MLVNACVQFGVMRYYHCVKVLPMVKVMLFGSAVSLGGYWLLDWVGLVNVHGAVWVGLVKVQGGAAE